MTNGPVAPQSTDNMAGPAAPVIPTDTKKPGGIQTPIDQTKQPQDQGDEMAGPSVAFPGAKAQNTSRQGYLDASHLEYLHNPSDLDIGNEARNADAQPTMSKIGRGFKLMGANFLSSLGNTLAGTFDLVADAKTAKAMFTGGNDDYNSSFFGITTKDMQDWSESVAKNNPVYVPQGEEGGFHPGSAGWWANEMMPQLGTLTGTAIGAAATTAAIEYATGGSGTAVAAARLGQIIKGVAGGAKAAELVADGLDLAKGMRGAAAMYATIGRYTESRFEAQNNYENTVKALKGQTKPDGTPYTDEEIAHAASVGAKIDFGLTMAQLPLDILAMRAMIFNPVSGSATGALERGLEGMAEKFGTSRLGKLGAWAATKGITAGVEGVEAGAIPIFQNIGSHYAQVVAGHNDGKGIGDIIGDTLTSPEFGNMIFSGVLGALTIGPALHGVQTFMTGNREQEFKNFYKDYLTKIPVLDSAIANQIQQLDAAGKHDQAASMRRQFSANKALAALHLDAMADKTTGFDVWRNFLNSTLEQVKQGNTDNIQDLFGKMDPTQTTQIQNEFQQYLDDADKMQGIYKSVSNKYDKSFVPEIAQNHFLLQVMQEESIKADQKIAGLQGNLQADMQGLFPQGQQVFKMQYTLNAMKAETDRLQKLVKQTNQPMIKQNVQEVLERVQDQQGAIADRLKELNADPTYERYMKNHDADVMDTSLVAPDFQQAIYNKQRLENEIALQRKNINLWNNPEFQAQKHQQAITSATNPQQVQQAQANLQQSGQATPETEEAANQASAKLHTQQAVNQIKAQQAASNAENEQEDMPGANDNPNVESLSQQTQQERAAEGEQVDPSAVPGNADLFGEPMQAIHGMVGEVGHATATTTTSTETTPNQSTAPVKFGPIELDKFKITNVNDLINDGAGKLAIEYDGNKVREAYHVIVNPTTKTATVNMVANGVGELNLATLYTFGNALHEKGITLQGGSKSQLWQRLKELSLAKDNNGTMEFTPYVKEAELQWSGEPEISLMPLEINMELTPEQRNRLTNSINQLLRGKQNPSFEDLVREAIAQSNDTAAENAFNLLAKGWEVTGHAPVDYRSIYHKVFDDPMASIASLLGELGKPNEESKPQDPVQIQEASEAATTDMVNNDQPPTDFDNQGNPVYNYTGAVTEETSKKFAFLSVPYVNVITRNEDGTYTLERQNINGELNEGDHVDSLRLLDPDSYTTGTPMQVRVPDNYNDIKVSVTNADGTPGTAIPFGQYVAERNLQPTDQEYRDKIPMMIYDKGKTTGRGLAFVHDVQWYNPMNFNQTKPGEMKSAIDDTRAMREEVLKAGNRPIDITITGKRETTFDGLRLPDGQHITLKEANPETQITVAKSMNELTMDGKNLAFQNQLMNTKPFIPGLSYDVRRTGTKDGQPMFTAFPILQPALSTEAKSSINLALRVYVNAQNPALSGLEKALHDRVHSQVLSSSGIDIRSITGISQYLKQFMHVWEGTGIDNVAKAEATLRAQGKPEGYKYLTINSGGAIIFGTLGVPMTPKSNGFFINANIGQRDPAAVFQMANQFLGQMTAKKFLDGYQQHVHFQSLLKNKPVVTFDNQGKPDVTPSYREHLLNNLQSDVKSVNIGTAEKPKWVTNVQPIITYESNSKLAASTAIPTTQEVAAQVVPPETQADEVAAEATSAQANTISTDMTALRESQAALIAQAREELGLDFLRPQDVEDLDADLLPMELSDDQRAAIADSINNIAGLNPQQQYQLIDFMYNQVNAMLESAGKDAVSKDQIYKKVKDSFEAVVKPLRASFISKADAIRKMIDLDPESPHANDMKLAVASYNRSIERINDIQAGYKLMEDETQKWVEKFTSIQKGQLKENKETDEEDHELDSTDAPADNGVAERNQEFGVDTLTVNPNEKITYAMRRFFSSIRQTDHDGNPAQGFLRLPLYVGADTVTTTLRDLLADVPSDFDTMMAKLEGAIPARPWLRELIDRLQGSNRERKNQFTTIMSNHRLSMKFSMIYFNRKTGEWNTKVFNTFQSGLAQQVALTWTNNFIESDLVQNSNEVYVLNEAKARDLVKEYRSWLGGSIKPVESSVESIAPVIRTISAKRPFVTVIPTDKLKAELDAKLGKTDGDEKLRFKYKGIAYQIARVGGQYQVDLLNANNQVDSDKARKWLEQIGIKLSDGTWNELMSKGLYHNFERVSKDALFTSNNGLFKILADKLAVGTESPNKDLLTGDGNPLTESVIRSLSNLEANYNTSINSPNGRDSGKSIFGFVAPKYVTDRTRDLKAADSQIVNQLASVSFSKKSFWLDLLKNSAKFRDQFSVSHIGLTAIKEMGKKSFRDNSIAKLSDTDHELTKLGMFWDTKQGEVEYDNRLRQYGDTGIDMRMSTLFFPTMSDKANMTLAKAPVLNLEEKHFHVNGDTVTIAGPVYKALYEQTVRPELLRMIRHAQIGGKTNVKAYDKGAKLFSFIPELNNVMFNENLRLVDAIAHGVEQFNLDMIEGSNEIKQQIYKVLQKTVDSLVKDKIAAWKENGIMDKDMNVLDSTYKLKFQGSGDQLAYKVAADFEINNMIGTANMFMLYAGDPAMFFKSKAVDPIEAIEESFVNVGKRLALLIAPGTTVANSDNEKYIQVFLQDRKSLPEKAFLKFATKINDGQAITDDEIAILQGSDKSKKGALAKKFPKSAGYFNIEGSDAQEYTTWREHLSLLERLGKTGDSVFDITPEEIQEARDLFSTWENGRKSKLTARQEALVGKVLQPMKPVYTGQVFDGDQDMMRTVYIKSSSFPLIPQMTEGMEIDGLRQAMEALEAKHGMGVRASYQTANKVGAVNNAVPVWNQDGTLNKDSLLNLDPGHKDAQSEDRTDLLNSPSLILDRRNFRIQQDVPFKSGKNVEDKITIGTQLMKILFGNGIIDQSGYKLDGKEYTGRELHNEYNQAFADMIKGRKDQLYDELGLQQDGTPVDAQAAIKRLQNILKDEAETRGYPLQDIDGLELDKDGNFVLPLWSSANSNRYESMLNSIVSNRMINIKLPGNSYVVGSEEGFRMTDQLPIDKSRIIFTSAWNGESLQGAYKKDGTIQKAQVLVASKFRDKDGKLIDLFTKKDGEYVYIEQGEKGFKLKEKMFEKDLLSLTSFRIPTSGHLSAAQVEIAGFLPAQAADLMIVPRNFTKQMGLDFDVDKQYTYQLWHHQNEDGSFSEINEGNKKEIMNEIAGKLKDGSNAGTLLSAIFGDDLPDFTNEEISNDTKLKQINAKLDEKILQNKIVKIHSAVLTHASDAVQSKINSILSTDYAEAQAEMIDGLIRKEQDTVFTPLSSEYQKKKMALGAAGKVGTGAYSLDLVFHSLCQQQRAIGNIIQLSQQVEDENGNVKTVPKEFRFGKQKSDGSLGGERTIDGDRTIAEVEAELQNVALDNEKLQIMGRVGLSSETIDVSKIFALLGFDKGDDAGKSSLQFLFLSQPIIRDYVDKIKNANSIIADFSADKEQKVIEALMAKYAPTYEQDFEERTSDYYDMMDDRMNTTELLNNLSSPNPDGKLQMAILERFLDMKKYGESLRGIQTGINTGSLGKSFFDVIAKKEALNRLASSKRVMNATGLIGDYLWKDNLEPDDYDAKLKDGYVDIGNYLVKPTSLSGSFNVHAVTTAYNLWGKHLPFDTEIMNHLYSEIMPVISSTDDSTALIDNRSVTIKQEVFREFKKFLSANDRTGIIGHNDSAHEERRMLYIDSPTNQSLASYISQLKQTNDNKNIDNFIKTNKLINRLELSIQKNGMPSLMKFNNAVGEDFDEQYLYQSLSTLLEAKAKLPDYNGMPWDTTKLAQHMIAYCYLGNAVQEAVQFTKFVPVVYNNLVGFSQFMREAGRQMIDDPRVIGGKIGQEDGNFLSDFAIQFIQHNPERVKFKIPEKELFKQITNVNEGKSTKVLSEVKSFNLALEDQSVAPKFVSVYNRSVEKGQNKFQLYMNQGDGTFVRIPVLGTFGMDEYNPNVQVAESLVNGVVKAAVIPGAGMAAPSASVDSFDVNSGNTQTVLQNIAKAGISGFSELASVLAPYTSNVKIGFADIMSTGQNQGNNVLINARIANQGDTATANTILHEVTHALTVQQIMPHINELQDGSTQVKDGAPEYVGRLVSLFNQTKRLIGQDAVNAIKDKIRAQANINQALLAASTDEERQAILSRANQNALTPEERRVTYGAYNIREFIAMALTQPEFQRLLGEQKAATGQSLLERFKDILKSILGSLGIKFDPGSVASQAINSIFELITDKNEKASSEAGRFNDIAETGFGTFEESLSDADKAMLDGMQDPDEMDYTEPETSLLPSVPDLNEDNCY